MPTNFYMLFLSALIPLIIGFIYYNPKVLGNVWMNTNNFTSEYLQKGNMPVIFIVTYVMGIFISFSLMSIVIHQGGVFSMLAPNVLTAGSEEQILFNDLMSKYGGNFRTFKHGALHGVLSALFYITPVIAINALFERRGWKYILVHAGYWIISLGLMGGLLCQTLTFASL